MPVHAVHLASQLSSTHYMSAASRLQMHRRDCPDKAITPLWMGVELLKLA